MHHPPQTVGAEDDRTYRLLGSSAASTTLWFVGGLVALVVGVLGFVASLLTGAGQIMVQLTTTLPILVAVGAFWTAWSINRSPREVTVGPSGLCITSRRDDRAYGWNEVGWSTIQLGGLNRRRNLIVYDNSGGILTKLSDSIEGFDALAERIADQVAAKPDDSAQRVQMHKARRSAVFVASVAVFLLVGAGVLVWLTRAEERASRLLGETNIEGEAEIVERFLAPNGITPRLVYRVTTADGQYAERSAEVERPFWDGLEGVETVAVVYVPEDPSISRLAHGEVVSDELMDQPNVVYAVCGLVTLMSLFFLASAALQWRGLDIDIDSKTGKISIKPFGSGR